MNRHTATQNEARELIVSGIHLELTPSLKTFVQEKADKLFRHEERILRIRIELECDQQTRDPGQRFIAKGHMQIHGPELNAAVVSGECHKSVNMLVDKLDRMLRRRSRFMKVQRHRTSTVQLAEAATAAIA
ncbi:30S ribosomal protein S30 [Opitutaceae bacterium TAV5]|nr:30S ribosomal protein S30 [Opitutaceae bacterium TAV5]